MMAEPVFKREQYRFDDCKGMDISHPPDRLPPGKYPYLENVRSYLGKISNRPGMMRMALPLVGKTPAHSCRRLNDELNSLHTLILGVQDRLCLGKYGFANIDGPYSGDPLALVPFQPRGSPESWMYVADRNRMRKVNRTGTVHQIGLPTPTVPPTIELGVAPIGSGVPAVAVIDDFEATPTGYTSAGTAGASSRITRYTSTINYILYDSGITGWATVQPVLFDSNLRPGMLLQFNPGGGATDETRAIQEIHPASSATTIGRILYDSGTTGDCSIHLSTPFEEIEVNSLVRLSGSENVRVRSISRSPDGLISFRCSTVGTHVNGAALQALASFRLYLVNNHLATETIRAFAMQSTFTTGTGTLTRTAALDMSGIATGIPTRPDDYMHISIRTDNPNAITEGKVMLDVDGSTNDFTRNFYYFAFRASDLTPSAKGTLTLVTTEQRSIQRDIIDQAAIQDTDLPFGMGRRGTEFDRFPDYGDYPRVPDTGSFPEATPETVTGTGISTQASVGDAQWTEFRFRIADLIRVGVDTARTLKDIASLRISLVTTGTVILDVDAWYVSGGYGPDVGRFSEQEPYTYRYRARVSTTGVRSNPSPPTRGPVTPYRQRIIVTPPAYSLASEADVLDIERFGGANLDWHYVGTVANGSAFSDELPDDVAVIGPNLGRSNFQPWPIIDLPKSGTVSSVAGTTVANTTNQDFNTSWPEGTIIKINGVPYTIYRVISNQILELYENAGNQGVVGWKVEEPILVGQPLPCLWGPFDGTFFGCGDPKNPGRLYFTMPDDPDSVGESTGTVRGGYIDITPSSEPLMNGVIHNSRAYVFSSERLFQILPTNDENRFTWNEIPNGKGLFSRWALTRIPGPEIQFLSRDGIYSTSGGEPQYLCGDLRPIFPNEGSLGNAVETNIATIYPVNIVPAQATNLRLDYCYSVLYFDYVDTTGARRTLIYDSHIGGWFADKYRPGAMFHYAEEGKEANAIIIGGSDATSALLYQLTGQDDNTADIECVALTPAHDMRDSRSIKWWGDAMLDLDTDGKQILAIPCYDSYTSSSPSTGITTTTRTQSPLNIDPWRKARNLGIALSWSVGVLTSNVPTGRPAFYAYEPRWIDDSGAGQVYAFETPPTTHGIAGYQYLGDAYIAYESTEDVYLTVTIDGVDQTSILLPKSSGLYTKRYLQLPPMKGKVFRYKLTTNGSLWRLYSKECEVRVKGWSDPGAYRVVYPFMDVGNLAA